MKLKEIKKGTFFTKKPIEKPDEFQVWIRGDYCRGIKKYECQRFADVNDIQYIHGDKEVFIDFEF